MARQSFNVWKMSALLATLSAGTMASPLLGQAGDGTVLPYPDRAFVGTVGRTPEDSSPGFAPAHRLKADAPNVLLVMTDDVGFGAASTMGGPVPTPNLDRLAARGLVYNRFHVTAMCSPSRAALLTGRNQHAAGTGALVDLAEDYPGYSGVLPQSAASIAKVLKYNGYNTAFFGKHHNIPRAEQSAAGPFDHWPTGLGFEYFYGFIGGAINQFSPTLYRNTLPVDLSGKPGDYILDRDLVSDAIGWIHKQKAAAPDKPFFIYFAPGTAHSPLQAPADWIARYRGRFDGGWDELRTAILARQKASGIVPQNTRMAPRPAEIPAWNSLSKEERKVYARWMEVFAAQLSHQDHEFGILIDELERMGQLDNTLILFIEGDNGASLEGGETGTLNEPATMANRIVETMADKIARIDELGGPNTISKYPAGWGWATNAPFPWGKQVASHLGGTRDPLIVSWPRGIAAKGEMRSQFGHLVDIYPTILEAAGVKTPERVEGVQQQPLVGTSLVYSFDDANAPERHRVQYFELFANRAIYADGWMASTTPQRVPWDFSDPAGSSDTSYEWELYDLRSDFGQARNLARSHPDKLAELRKLWEHEAARNNVFPLNHSFSNRNVHAARSAGAGPVNRYVYWGSDIHLPQSIAPRLSSRDFVLEVTLDDFAADASGILLATGSRFGGWAFSLSDGRPLVRAVRSEKEGDQWEVVGSELPAGTKVVAFGFVTDTAEPGSGGSITILADGRPIGSGRIEGTAALAAGFEETFDIGSDTGATVSPNTRQAGKFVGTISKVVLETGSRAAP